MSGAPNPLTAGADLTHLELLLDPAQPLEPQLAALLLEEYGDVALWMFRGTRDRTPIRGERWTQLPGERVAAGVSPEAVCAELAQHLLRVRAATIGLCVPTGLVAFDGDSHEVAAYLEGHAPLGCPVQKSPRGVHVFARYPAGARIQTTQSKTGRKAEIAPGIVCDVKSGNERSRGYVIAWPSRGRGERTYAWLSRWSSSRDEIPLGPVQWLRAVTVREPEPPRARSRSRVSRGAWAGGPIPEGERDKTLFAHASRLQRLGLSDRAIEAELLHVNATFCAPPMPESIVQQKVRSALRYPKGADA